MREHYQGSTPKQRKPIKTDPFEDSTSNDGEVLDLTATPSKYRFLPHPSSAYPSSDQQDAVTMNLVGWPLAPRNTLSLLGPGLSR
jgi:hypothetical protein